MTFLKLKNNSLKIFMFNFKSNQFSFRFFVCCLLLFCFVLFVSFFIEKCRLVINSRQSQACFPAVQKVSLSLLSILEGKKIFSRLFVLSSSLLHILMNYFNIFILKYSLTFRDICYMETL